SLTESENPVEVEILLVPPMPAPPTRGSIKNIGTPMAAIRKINIPEVINNRRNGFISSSDDAAGLRINFDSLILSAVRVDSNSMVEQTIRKMKTTKTPRYKALMLKPAASNI